MMNKDIIAINFSVFVFFMGYTLINPVLPEYVKSFFVTFIVAGIMMSLHSLARIFVNIPIGILADRGNKKVLVVSGMLLNGFASLMIVSAQETIKLSLGILLLGIGSSLVTLSSLTLIVEVSSIENRTKNLGYFAAFISASHIIGSIMGGFIAEKLGMMSCFYFFSFFALLGATLFYRVKERPKSKSITEGKKVDLRDIFSMFSSFPSFALVIVIFVKSLIDSGIVGSLTVWYGRMWLQFDTTSIGLLLGVYWLGRIMSNFLAGILAEYMEKRLIIVLSTFFTGLCIFSISFSNSLYELLLKMMLLGFVHGFTVPSCWALIMDKSKRGAFGLEMGAYRIFEDIGMVLGPILIGYLLDEFGMLFPFYITSILSIVSASFMFAARMAEGDQERKKK